MNTYYIELPKSDCGQSEVIKTTASSKKSAFEFIEDIYNCPKSSLRCLKSSCKVNRFEVIINDDNTGYFSPVLLCGNLISTEPQFNRYINL